MSDFLPTVAFAPITRISWHGYDDPVFRRYKGQGNNAATNHLPRQRWFLEERNVISSGMVKSLLFTLHARPGGWTVPIINPSGCRTYESYLPLDQATSVSIGADPNILDEDDDQRWWWWRWDGDDDDVNRLSNNPRDQLEAFDVYGRFWYILSSGVDTAAMMMVMTTRMMMAMMMMMSTDCPIITEIS